MNWFLKCIKNKIKRDASKLLAPLENIEKLNMFTPVKKMTSQLVDKTDQRGVR
ncbi:hypothetical protein LGAA44_150003 [Leuconostoc gasicomitatum]|nr:hypothetical protein LGAA44_150003 [Leuconostoc gasicomitatum]